MKKNSKGNFSIGSIIWGIVLVSIGIIFALNSLDITNIDIFFDGWWTLFIIVPCTINLLTERDNFVGNAPGIFIGVFLLLCCRGILQFSMIWKLLLPILVVIVGLKLILKGLFGRGEDTFEIEIDCEDNESHKTSAIFSAHRINYDGMVFQSTELNVVFGGVQLDLRKAIIEGDCTVRANSIFGGITILVPEDVNVKINNSSVFGGCSNKTAENSGAHTIYVHCNSIFGGVSVK